MCSVYLCFTAHSFWTSSRPVRVKTDVFSSFRCVAVDLFVLSFRHILIICFVSKVTGLGVCLVWSAVACVVSQLTQMFDLSGNLSQRRARGMGAENAAAPGIHGSGDIQSKISN